MILFHVYDNSTPCSQPTPCRFTIKTNPPYMTSNTPPTHLSINSALPTPS